MTARAVSLFGEPATGRVRAGLERSLRVLRDGGALDPTDRVRVAVLRTLVDKYDHDARRADVSAFAMANAARAITDLFNALAGNAGLMPSTGDGDDVDALVASLSTPYRDAPPA